MEEKSVETKLQRKSKAFVKALDYCETHGLDWHTHIQPITDENDETIGYFIHVADETSPATATTILIIEENNGQPTIEVYSEIDGEIEYHRTTA